MNNLLSLKFWISLRPGFMEPAYFRVFAVFTIAFFVLIFISSFIKTRNKKNLYGRFWQMLNSFCLTNAIVGAILLFFTYEAVPFLSARFWFLLWGIEIAIWIVFMARVLIDIPKRKEKLAREKEYKKYIP